MPLPYLIMILLATAGVCIDARRPDSRVARIAAGICILIAAAFAVFVIAVLSVMTAGELW